MRPILLFSLPLVWATTALAATVGYGDTLTISNKNVMPDGFQRLASVVNGGTPGPAITAQKASFHGDRVRINVVNELTDVHEVLGTSIHWHGIFQSGTNFMDGVAGVTQCPIAPKDSFQYDFPVKQAGTFWYHSHFGVQYCDGVRGALVVYDPEDPLNPLYDVDDESTIITVAEWYHTPAVDLLGGLSSADSTLINGLGRYPGGPNSELAVVNVQQGKRYRLRLISMSCEPDFIFSIDGHNLTVIEADGVSVQPEVVDNIQIFTAQRYSIVLEASQPVDNYWIRALPSSGNRNLNSTFANGVNSAILRYSGASIQEPTTQQPPLVKRLAEANLHPDPPIPVPGKATPDGADQIFNFEFGFNELGNFTVNNATYIPPAVPILLQILNGDIYAGDLLPKGSVYTIQRGQTIQVNLPGNFVASPHPFHLHGHHFNVIRVADSDTYNFDNPIVRDTVDLGSTDGGIVSIRFVADNPGPWILHCHNDFHLAGGMAIVFAEAPNDVASLKPDIPHDWYSLCPTWNAQPSEVRHAGNT